jgi:hypothetical protein
MKFLIRCSQLARRLLYVNKFEKSIKDPLHSQEKILLKIIRKNENTAFGKEHNFKDINSIESFRKNVPISDYKKLNHYIERMKAGEKNILTAQDPIMFGITSGTTSAQKFIPITKDFVDEYKASWQDWIYYALKDNPKMFDEKILTFVSPPVIGKTQGNIPYGSISGLIHDIQPKVIKNLYCLDPVIFRIKDYDSRYYTICYFILQDTISTIITPSPSLILLIFKKLNQFSDRLIEDIRIGTINHSIKIEPEIRKELEKKMRPRPKLAEHLASMKHEKGVLYPKDIWPEIVLIGCWKEGSMPLYLRQLPRYFGNMATRDIGLMATEGRISIPISNQGGAGVIAADSHFYEFIPEEDMHRKDPQALSLSELQLNKNYFVIMTASNGLYRYNLNDIVRVIDYKEKTPVIDFLHKGETAVRHATHKLDAPVDSFTASIRLSKPPCYVFNIEFHENMLKERKQMLIKEIDHQLMSLNIEYKTKRESMRLGSPILRHIRAGSFEKRHMHLASMGAHDAQIKHPCLVDDLKFDSHFRQHLDIIDEIAPIKTKAKGKSKNGRRE